MKQIDKPLNLLKKYWWLFLVMAFLLVILDSLIRGLDWSYWAESAEPQGPRAITLWGRSLWDWADLLLVPLVLAIGGFLLQRSERKTDREIAEKRHKSDQQIAKEAHMDKTLDEYLKAMTGLLLQEDSLLKSKKDDPIRNVARTQTITVVKRLDSDRNRIVFHFLQEANLLSTRLDDVTEVQKPLISLAHADLIEVYLKKVDLKGADLKEAYMPGTDLYGSNLRGADLEEANMPRVNLVRAFLEEANLKGAYLQEADLREAHLEGASLKAADLRKANLERANLSGANLSGAKMPDGTIFSEFTDLEKFINPPKEE